ncbi:MAG: polysaccharide biosynthesis tyrosine autokinase [Burkholderiales bacterium]|jgi:protein-tyrosine kinase|nr:polysaccharide biosynthesis tyrosine autokinase [Burkholderiales bacterium]MBP7521798.1 polysaccharide biosynthesis tyrosine autokinase [Leptothrix sp. (in: b-proteobacteria)]HQY08343.1 polysaccharide biosynthesis tyrosine autokinase [Burkholderiaceae bacterium]
MNAPARSAAAPRGPTLVHPQPGDDVHSRFDEDRSIGDIIRETKNLTEDQVQSILEHQRQHGLRFGESAVALGLVTDSDVVFALSQQFHYPYTPDERRGSNPELVLSSQPFSKQAEAFRAIRSQLMMRVFNPAEPKRALAVLSPDSGDGKTFFVGNLGVALAQLGGRTLVVDADLRSPGLHRLFGIPNQTGLSSILSGRQEENVIFQAPDIPSLYVMPVGVTPPNPLELLERPAFRLLMGELLRKFDHVIVDTPAHALGTDAAVVASKCGAALMLARKDKSRVNRLQDLVATVGATNAKLAGVIVNEF